MEIIRSVQNRIYELRGARVMLDFDLATLYEVETRVLNQSVRRNIERFPPDFLFQLTPLEHELIKHQIKINQSSSQIVMMETIALNRTDKYLPYAFTEQGIAMLSGILRSPKAIHINIASMRAFIELRKVLIDQTDIIKQLEAIKERIGEHDLQLNQLYEAMDNLIDSTIAQKRWNDRERIGFKPDNR